jgi:hypothetical protein
MNQFLLGLAAGLAVGLALEWIVDWSGFTLLGPTRPNPHGAAKRERSRPAQTTPRPATQDAAEFLAAQPAEPDHQAEA